MLSEAELKAAEAALRLRGYTSFTFFMNGVHFIAGGFFTAPPGLYAVTR